MWQTVKGCTSSTPQTFSASASVFESLQPPVLTVSWHCSAEHDQNKTILDTYRVGQNKIPHWIIYNISATSGLIFKILEAA